MGAPAGALTSRERGQWFLHQVGGATVVNLGFSLRFTPQLRWWPLQEALNQLLRRHEALRQTFPAVGGVPVRMILPADDAEVPLEVVRGSEELLHELISEQVAVPFDLATGPLIRAVHLLLDDTSLLLVVAHHLVVDAFSTFVLADEFAYSYGHFADGTPLAEELSQPVAAHRDPQPSPEQIEQWRQRLADLPTAAPLSGARSVVGVPTFAGALASVATPQRLRDQVAQLRAGLKATDGIILLALCATLLHRHGAGDDLVIGVPVNLRRGPESARVVGFHVSTVPVRLRFTPEASFRDLVGQARTAMLEILAGSTVSFEDILEHVGHRSADWRAPMFRHVVNLQPLTSAAGHSSVLREHQVRLHRAGSRTDLELVWDLGRHGAELQAWYSTEVHQQAEVEALLERFPPLVEAAHADPDAPVATLAVASSADRAVLAAANSTAADLPESTLLDLVRAVPLDRTAFVDAAGSWSYRRLWSVADGVAARLLERGVVAGDRVAVVGVRGPWLAAAVLGSWLCGAAYVPLDPALPPARVPEITAGVAAVLSPDGSRPGLPTDSTIDVSALPASSSAPRPPGASPAAPAVIVYTSGSTGRPKGVVVGHRAMLNVVKFFSTLLELGPADRTLWSTTFAFDVSALELFLPLTTGGTAVVATDEDRRRPAELLALIEREQVSVVQATPTSWRELVPVVDQELAGVRVLCGGEPLTGPLASQLLATGCRLFNVYGPSETTIWSTVAELTEPVCEPVPIGRPIANTTIEIRDAAGLGCPPGIVGELCIGGLGLADGYLDQPELTVERFPGVGDARRYRSGDLARWRADGALILHGRDDRQVKLRGARIELGSIEAVLERHEQVRSAAVCVLPDAHGEEVLTAFVRPEEAGAEPGLAERLWQFACEQLPSQETPNRVVPVPELPTTANGKVDYGQLAKWLPAATPAGGSAAEQLPEDPVVRGLLTIWRELLGSHELGPDDNFFLNGGHSLLAARLLTVVADRLGQEVSYEQLFSAPTPARLGELLRGGASEGRTP